jgi:hypothetical protein
MGDKNPKKAPKKKKEVAKAAPAAQAPASAKKK